MLLEVNGYLFKRVSTLVVRIPSQVTHSQRLKLNFEENKTAKSYFSCSLSSRFLGGFGAVPGISLIFFLLRNGKRKNSFNFFKIRF